MGKGFLNYSDLKEEVAPEISDNMIDEEWLNAVEKLKQKIIVLDDDPTGVQTVHSIPVYTTWDKETFVDIFNNKEKVNYILTNSRSLTAEDSEKLHVNLINNIKQVANEDEFIIISRGDSTLRGHYPLETETIKSQLSRKIDGEIIIPFFFEGGRFTYNDIHYVLEKDKLIPVAETEFANDSTFGYKSSDLKEWIREKYGMNINNEIKSISLSELRNKNIKQIKEKLLSLKNFDKLIVNALNYNDLKVFITCFEDIYNQNKNYIFRTAASFVRIIGGIKEKELLNKENICVEGDYEKPALIVIGSHTNLATKQYKKLLNIKELNFIEFDARQAISEEKIQREIKRATRESTELLANGKDLCIFTTREYFDFSQATNNNEDNLIFSNRISDGVVEVIKNLQERPAYILAKGGITSSDIGVKALGVKKAMVLGQILPGVPVWELGEESKYPGMPYIIFPGNVGKKDDIRNIYLNLKFY